MAGMRIVILLCLFAAAAPAAEMKPIVLWPKGAPGESAAMEEKDTTDPNGRLVGGRRVMRITGISSPTITV